MYISFKAGCIDSYRVDGTIADGCDVATPGELTFNIVKALVSDIVLVSEQEIKSSMLALIQYNKIVSEGAGALATAALLSGRLNHYIEGKNTVSIISGGNVDLSRISAMISSLE